MSSTVIALRAELQVNSGARMNSHEAAFVEAFIVKVRRERALELIANAKNRHKLTSKFDHHGRDYFIPECIRPILPRYQHPPEIASLLREMGAPENCHFIGGKRDSEEMELLPALKEVVGYGEGTVLSCIPGKLAYFEGEFKERFLLVRP
jgi:hypothetical protein